MEALSSRLQGILERLDEMYDRMIVVAAEMNEALRGQRVADVQKSLATYDELVFQLDGLEEQRLEACDRIAAQVRPGGRRHLTLTQILEAVPPSCRQPLAAVRDRLKGRIARLNELNVSNRIFLQERLQEIGRTLELATRYEPKYHVYQKQGSREARTCNRPLLNRVA